MAKYDLSTITNEDLLEMIKQVLGRWVNVFNDCYGKAETPHGPYGVKAYMCLEKDIEVVMNSFGISMDYDAKRTELQNVFWGFIECSYNIIVLSFGKKPDITKEQVKALLNAAIKYAKTEDDSGFESPILKEGRVKDYATLYRLRTEQLFFKRSTKKVA